jgi:sulfur relay (sulfurtransferase) complex TusBCD TusD component (DsrE family)
VAPKVEGKQGKSLGILLASSPNHEDRFTAIKLAQTALGLGIVVKVFLYDEGVYNCLDNEFISLNQAGVDITICEQSAKDRNLDIQAPVKRGSLYDLAGIAKQVDRLVSFI